MPPPAPMPPPGMPPPPAGYPARAFRHPASSCAPLRHHAPLCCASSDSDANFSFPRLFRSAGLFWGAGHASTIPHGSAGHAAASFRHAARDADASGPVHATAARRPRQMIVVVGDWQARCERWMVERHGLRRPRRRIDCVRVAFEARRRGEARGGEVVVCLWELSEETSREPFTHSVILNVKSHEFRVLYSHRTPRPGSPGPAPEGGRNKNSCREAARPAYCRMACARRGWEGAVSLTSCTLAVEHVFHDSDA